MRPAALAAAASHGLDSDTAAGLLAAFGLLGGGDGGAGAAALPARLAPVLALVEALPGGLTERLLVELLARVVEPATAAPATVVEGPSA